jgi:glutathione S-transferase
VLELWQAEWCPYSHRVRQRLTELGLDFVAHQVAAEKDDRPGRMSIPRLRTDDGTTLDGDEEILAWLEASFEPRDDARRHRAKARAEVPAFDEVAS